MPRKFTRPEVPACAEVAFTVPPATLPWSNCATSVTGARSIVSVEMTVTGDASLRVSTSRPVPVTTISSSEIAERLNSKLAVPTPPAGTLSVARIELYPINRTRTTAAPTGTLVRT